MSLRKATDTVSIRVREQRPPRRRRIDSAVIGGLILAIIALIAIFADAIAPYPPNSPVDGGPFVPPGDDANWLGTDQYSRDLLSRLIHGARITMFVGVSVTVLVCVFGLLLGVTAGYFGGWFDALVSRFTELIQAIPSILLAIVLLAILGPGVTSVVVALVIVYTPDVLRIARGNAMQHRTSMHIVSAQAIGASPPRILFKHVLPFVAGPVVVQATFTFAYAVLAEAALSFLGVGVQPPTASWGNMISESLPYLSSEPALVLIPSLAISLVVFAANLFGDGVRDRLDPQKGI
jgi:ABC-type dipeptide/oligopeptide/nickel transport system permease subunit